jgi:hypothetical protein
MPLLAQSLERRALVDHFAAVAFHDGVVVVGSAVAVDVAVVALEGSGIPSRLLHCTKKKLAFKVC